ncbi:MAG: porin [Saprospiraceae bacterium]|nr:porin [Saprospiraceae bacterium]
MKNSQLPFLLLILIFSSLISLTAQEAPAEDHTYKPLTLKLNETGSKYVRFIMWHQFWMTATQNNPGTRDVNGQLIDGTNGSNGWSSDIALRRSRFLAYAQISPRVMILTHWGINNQSFINGATAPNGPNPATNASNQGKKPQLFLHDAWTEFRVVPQKLYIGVGLHYWNGVSRLGSHSTLNFMTLDAPIFNWHNIEATDQFARQFGVYAKGQIGKLDYRVALNKPFVNGTAPTSVARNGIAVNTFSENYATSGYFNWMFWGKESNVLPFYVGSYLGTKKILNIGVGWYHQSNGSLYKTETDSIFQGHTALGADVFLDMPVNKEKGTAISVLATLYSFDYGTNYLRNIGILNEHTTAVPTTISFAGGGNAQPTIGSGTIGYLQTGFVLPKLKNGTSFMPYLTATYKDFERLKDPSLQWGLGMNYFVTGHHAKLTLEYQTRPIYKAEGSEIIKDGSRGQFIFQSHVFL